MDKLDYYWSMFDTVRDILVSRGITDIDIIRLETEKRINKNVGHEVAPSTDSITNEE